MNIIVCKNIETLDPKRIYNSKVRSTRVYGELQVDDNKGEGRYFFLKSIPRVDIELDPSIMPTVEGSNIVMDYIHPFYVEILKELELKDCTIYLFSKYGTYLYKSTGVDRYELKKVKYT